MLGNLIRDLLPYLLSGQLPFATFARLVWMLVPAVAIYALPMGMLTGVLLTLGRLSADSEITAMRTAGLSLARIARPVFILGALGTALGLYVNFESMPHARVQYHKELDDAVRANPLSFIVPKTFIRNFKGYVIYVGDKQGAVMRDFLALATPTARVAPRSSCAPNPAASTTTAPPTNSSHPHPRPDRGAQSQAAENFSESPRIGSFEKSEPQRISLAKLYGPPTVRQKLQWMTYAELRAEEARGAALPFTPTTKKEHARIRDEGAAHRAGKINTALAVLSFASSACPSASRSPVARRAPT